MFSISIVPQTEHAPFRSRFVIQERFSLLSALRWHGNSFAGGIDWSLSLSLYSYDWLHSTQSRTAKFFCLSFGAIFQSAICESILLAKANIQQQPQCLSGCEARQSHHFDFLSFSRAFPRECFPFNWICTYTILYSELKNLRRVWWIPEWRGVRRRSAPSQLMLARLRGTHCQDKFQVCMAWDEENN